MNAFPYISPYRDYDAPWVITAALCFITVALIFAYRLIKYRPLVADKQYCPRLAWQRAILYFCITSLIAMGTGVTQAIMSSPLVTEAQLSNLNWWLAFGGCCIVLIIGYCFIWPAGTFTDGRSRHWITTTLFGVMWGISQGQLFLSFWALMEFTGLSLLWVSILTFTLISVYNGNWQQFYWDIKVSPPHNYEAWNVRKVLLAHVPNLCVTLPFLAIYGNVQIYILFQTFALLWSAHAMRFPSWLDEYTAVAGATR